MSARVSPLAGKPAPDSILVDVPRLLAAYVDDRPDPSVPSQRVSFGTSGHRGSSLERSFNAWHVLAITQAICDYRHQHGIDGPLFLGIDTHALSEPAMQSALEVLAANDVTTLVAANGEFTPTPAVSLAILNHNRGRETGLADGIVVTPSHNPPDNGGFKYNPPSGGPAQTDITRWIENKANAYLEAKLHGVKRLAHERVRSSGTVKDHDFLGTYVAELASAVDFDLIRSATLHLGVDPLGGAGVHYWAPIAERYKLDLTVVSEQVDPTFRFMSVDWDGQIRMDPSSRYAMQRLIGLKNQYDLAFACDTDHDRFGIVTRSHGLMPANHYLAVLAHELFKARKYWPATAAVGKTVVSTALLDRIARKLKRPLYETPVGFKWFVDGLLDASLGFAGEESAGASVLRMDGSAWTTDKDGIVAGLLSAELMARSERDPGETYDALVAELGEPFTDRLDGAATDAQKKKLASLSPDAVRIDTLAGEKVTSVIDRAPGNDAPIGGIKVNVESGWFAARPSGTEDIYKIYAESFRDQEHLATLLAEAQSIVDRALGKSNKQN